jgi:hypothetical protein
MRTLWTCYKPRLTLLDKSITEDYVQSDEVDVGITYDEVSIFEAFGNIHQL